jgi:hypothetical protein
VVDESILKGKGILPRVQAFLSDAIELFSKVVFPSISSQLIVGEPLTVASATLLQDYSRTDRLATIRELADAFAYYGSQVDGLAGSKDASVKEAVALCLELLSALSPVEAVDPLPFTHQELKELGRAAAMLLAATNPGEISNRTVEAWTRWSQQRIEAQRIDRSIARALSSSTDQREFILSFLQTFRLSKRLNALPERTVAVLVLLGAITEDEELKDLIQSLLSEECIEQALLEGEGTFAIGSKERRLLDYQLLEVLGVARDLLHHYSSWDDLPRLERARWCRVLTKKTNDVASRIKHQPISFWNDPTEAAIA